MQSSLQQFQIHIKGPPRSLGACTPHAPRPLLFPTALAPLRSTLPPSLTRIIQYRQRYRRRRTPDAPQRIRMAPGKLPAFAAACPVLGAAVGSVVFSRVHTMWRWKTPPVEHTHPVECSVCALVQRRRDPVADGGFSRPVGTLCAATSVRFW